MLFTINNDSAIGFASVALPLLEANQYLTTRGNAENYLGIIDTAIQNINEKEVLPEHCQTDWIS